MICQSSEVKKPTLICGNCSVSQGCTEVEGTPGCCDRLRICLNSLMERGVEM